MKRFSLHAFLLIGAMLLVSGCGHLEIESAGDANRVLKGTITAGAILPAGTEVVVRLVATGGASAASPITGDLGLPNRGPMPPPATERVLGEHRQILAAATNNPVPFQIEYQVDDAVLRRGLNVDARISVGGKLRFRTINAHVVTLASSPYPQSVSVQPVQ